eukprot:m.328697 g.328697  ORF g.328697 m.328697 type:complete len:121 (+) comp56396_c0_seq1:1-363(+)
MTALHYAAIKGHTDTVVELLLQQLNPAQVNACTVSRSTALHLACLQGHRQVVQQLVAAGADQQLRNSRLETAREIAMARRHWAVVDILERPSSLRRHNPRTATTIVRISSTREKRKAREG